MLLLGTLSILSEAVSIRRRKHMFGEDPITAPNLSKYRPEVTQVYKRRKPNNIQENENITLPITEVDKTPTKSTRPSGWRHLRAARKQGDPKAIEFFDKKNAERREHERSIRARFKEGKSSFSDDKHVTLHRARQKRYKESKVEREKKGEVQPKPKPLLDSEAQQRLRDRLNRNRRAWYQRMKEGRKKGDAKATQAMQTLYNRVNTKNKSRRQRVKEGIATEKDIEAQEKANKAIQKYRSENPDKVRSYKKKSYHKRKAEKENAIIIQ